MAFIKLLVSPLQNLFSSASEDPGARTDEGGDHGGPSPMSLMACNYLEW